VLSVCMYVCMYVRMSVILWNLEELTLLKIYTKETIKRKIKPWDPTVRFWQPLEKIKKIKGNLDFYVLLGFAIRKIGVFRLPWAAKN